MRAENDRHKIAQSQSVKLEWEQAASCACCTKTDAPTESCQSNNIDTAFTFLFLVVTYPWNPETTSTPTTQSTHSPIACSKKLSWNRSTRPGQNRATQNDVDTHTDTERKQHGAEQDNNLQRRLIQHLKRSIVEDNDVPEHLASGVSSLGLSCRMRRGTFFAIAVVVLVDGLITTVPLDDVIAVGDVRDSRRSDAPVGVLGNTRVDAERVHLGTTRYVEIATAEISSVVRQQEREGRMRLKASFLRRLGIFTTIPEWCRAK